MMNILGIDSSGLVASVALQSDDKLVGEYTIHNKKTHSQTLLPMIHDMLEMADVSVKELDAIAIASGPGSFTGLRIGAATAKGLGGALSIPLIAVPTLEGLAYNLVGAEALVCPIMDARRQQAYYGIYDVSNEVPVEIEKLFFWEMAFRYFRRKSNSARDFCIVFAQTACGIRERLLSQRLERNIMSRADR